MRRSKDGVRTGSEVSVIDIKMLPLGNVVSMFLRNELEFDKIKLLVHIVSAVR